MNEETFFFSNEIHSDDLYLPVNLTSERGTLFTDYLSVQADLPDSWRCAEGAIEEQRDYYNGRYFEADYHIRGMWWKMSYSLYYGIERQLSHNPIVSHVSLTCLTENSRIHLQLLKVDGSEIRSMGEKIYFYYEENVFVEEGLQTIEVYNSGSPDRPEEGFYQNNFAIKKLSKNK